MSHQYNPAVFDVRDIEGAKQIILTPERQRSTAERWDRETPHQIELMAPLGLSARSVVLDYGCGIGRLSKALIDKFGCKVIGVDISPSMRALAAAHVSSPNFFCCAPEALDWALFSGRRIDAAISVWALQHVLDLKREVLRISTHLDVGLPLFVVNEGGTGRVVPTNLGWVNDGVDLPATLLGRFDCETAGKMDAAVVTQEVSDRTFWAIYRKRG